METTKGYCLDPHRLQPRAPEQSPGSIYVLVVLVKAQSKHAGQ